MKKSILACLLLLGCVAPACAANYGAAVFYSSYKPAFEIRQGNGEKPEINELGLTISASVNSWFAMGVEGGYSVANYNPGDHPASDGYDLTGRFFGVVAKFDPRVTDWLAIRLQAAFRRHRVDNGRVDAQYDQLVWNELMVKLGPQMSVGTFDFTIGGYYVRTDGREDAWGPLDYVRDIRADGESGIFARIAVRTEGDSYIGLYAKGGARQAVGIVFSTGF